MRKQIFYQAREKQTERAEQLQHNGNLTEAMASEINHDLVCVYIEVSAVYRFWCKPYLTVLKSCEMMP